MGSGAFQSAKQRVGAALFFGLFLLIGCAVLVSLIQRLVIREWRANHRFAETQCTILDKRIVEHEGEDGPTYRPVFRVRYTVAGNVHEVWTYDAAKISVSGKAYGERTLEEFTVGQQYPCWYDPDDPGTAVLVRGTSWFLYLFLVVPLAPIAVGSAGIWFVIWGKAKEPQSVVPSINAKAGDHLRYALPRARTPGCVVVFLAVITAAFLPATVILVLLAIYGFVIGEPDWCLPFVAIAFILASLFLLVLWFKLVLVDPLYWSPRLEISSHPLLPGQSWRLSVARRGMLQLAAMQVRVVCEEIRARDNPDGKPVRMGYGSGVAKPAYDAAVFWFDPRDMGDGEFQIPSDAKHSLKDDEHEIQWRIVIRGKAFGWLHVFWEYPFVVQPSPPAAAL